MTGSQPQANNSQQYCPPPLHQFQALPGAFTRYYNTRRPHRSLPHRATPATAYTARPKATPATGPSAPRTASAPTASTPTASSPFATPASSTTSASGRTYARTHILLLVQDLNIRVINAATGELLRQLTLDPTRNYQPTGKPRRPKKKTP
jgi:hypothetical protein